MTTGAEVEEDAVDQFPCSKVLVNTAARCAQMRGTMALLAVMTKFIREPD